MTRQMLYGLCALSAICHLSEDLSAQVPVRAVSALPATASMEEVKTWVERELAAMGSDVHVLRSSTKTEFVTKYHLDQVAFVDCRLSYRTKLQGTTGREYMSTTTLSLRDVDLDSLVARASALPNSSWGQNKPSISLHFRALRDRDEPFTYSDESRKERTDRASVHLRDTSAADVVINVMRRAATLCANEPPPSSRAMTNAEVLQLSAAGLSDQVVSTSIRQARSRNFDLSPSALIALKKANVSDVVIQAMQAPDSIAAVAPLTSARERRDSATAADAVFKASLPGRYYRNAKPSDYLELMADGSFILIDGRRTFRGRYTMRGTRSASFTSEGPSGDYLGTPAGKTIQVFVAGDSIFDCADGPGCRYVRLSSTTFRDPQAHAYWERTPSRNAAIVAAEPGASRNPTNGCADIDFLSVALVVRGGGLMQGKNAYAARVRNRASYTTQVSFEYTMNGKNVRRTGEVRGGEIVNFSLGIGPTPPTNVQMVSCK